MTGLRPSIPLPAAVIAALLGAACSDGPSPAPSASGTPTGAPPTTLAIPGELPASTAATATVAPTLGAWQRAPEQPALAGMEFGDLAWTGARFVAIAHTEAGGTFVDASDGGAWHRQSGGAEWQPVSVAASGGRVAAVGTIGEKAASWVSPDGLTWTLREDAFPTPSIGTDTVEVTDLVATDDGWVAVGRRDVACFLDCGLTSKQAYVWTSSDGLAWTRVADQDSLEGGGMVAVARTAGGLVAGGVADGHAAIWTSPDGQVWSRVPDDPMFGPPGGATIAEEPVQQEPPVSVVDVAVRDGVVVVVGQSYGQDVCDPARADDVCPGIRVWWSADGTSWSRAAVDGARDGQAAAVTATADGFTAVGFATGCPGGVLTSVDGRAWHCAATDAAFEGFAPADVAASETAEVVVGTTFLGDDDSSPPPRATAWYRARG